MSGEQLGGTRIDPATGFVDISTRDADFAKATSAIWVGSAGNIAMTLLDGTTALVEGIPAGTYLPVRARQIQTTGTTAAIKILGLTNQ